MHKIAFFLVISLPLFAGFFPKTIHTSIEQVSDKSIVMKHSFPVNGMSGVVIHPYSVSLNAITSRMVQTSARHGDILKDSIVYHDKLPTINTPVKKGDKVIGGYLYENVLLLAPNAQIYQKFTSTYTKNWIHPDLYALYLAKEGDTVPSKENLASFAKSYQVGLIMIVGKNQVKLLDPISGKTVGKMSISAIQTKAKSPFFMRFDKIEAGLFSSSNSKNYYQLMKSL